MQAAIIDKIRKADNLPSLPTVAIQVLKMTQADDVSLNDIAAVIQQDPALVGKILKLVNSSMFGMSRKISSLQQAMMVLGLRTVKVMVLSFSLVETLNKRKTGSFDYVTYWRRSLTTAVTARLLGESIQRAIADEAFVSGLLCDIGMLAAWICAKDHYVPVIDAQGQRKCPLQTVEHEVLGVTHEAMTATLLGHWGLPEPLCIAASSHHAPMETPIAGDATLAQLARILRASALIADLFCEETGATLLDDARKTIVAGLPIDEDTLNGCLEKLDEQVRETASLFALNIGTSRSYQELQSEAMAQLARLSMNAELERVELVQREQQVRKQVEQLNDQNRELNEQITRDALTGVSSRAAFDQRLSQALAQCASRKQSLGLLMIDLDRFKRLNDTFGHQTGDETLRQVGACLAALESDARFAARYGGEEFALVVLGQTAVQLCNLAEEVRLKIAELRIPHGRKKIAITASIGGCSVDAMEPGLSPTAVVQRADAALYDAKNQGRNRMVMHAARARVRVRSGGG